jgi:hypothetical protein
MEYLLNKQKEFGDLKDINSTDLKVLAASLM